MACASKPSPQRPQRLQVLVLLLSLALCSPAHGFWFTSARAKSQAPQWFGIRDYPGAAQAAYSYDSTGGVAVAVPVAVPLSPHQLQVSPPYPGLNSVQLVPCLCPISKDPDSIKPMSSMATGPMHQVSSMSSMHVVQPSAVQQNAQPSQQHAQMQQQQ